MTRDTKDVLTGLPIVLLLIGVAVSLVLWLGVDLLYVLIAPLVVVAVICCVWLVIALSALAGIVIRLLRE